MMTTALEILTIALLSVFLFAVWSDPQVTAVLPWAGLSGFLAWNRGGWGRS